MKPIINYSLVYFTDSHMVYKFVCFPRCFWDIQINKLKNRLYSLVIFVEESQAICEWISINEVFEGIGDVQKGTFNKVDFKTFSL